MCKNRLSIRLASPLGTIDPRVHGQFIEHLGTCIYDGVWEGTDASLQAHNSADEPERLVPSVRRLPLESRTVRHTFPAASITKLQLRGR